MNTSWIAEAPSSQHSLTTSLMSVYIFPTLPPQHEIPLLMIIIPYIVPWEILKCMVTNISIKFFVAWLLVRTFKDLDSTFWSFNYALRHVLHVSTLRSPSVEPLRRAPPEAGSRVCIVSDFRPVFVKKGASDLVRTSKHRDRDQIPKYQPLLLIREPARDK